jgi:hypothetical protein
MPLTLVGPVYRANCYLHCIGRVHDYRNFDYIKQQSKFPDVMPRLYKQFGILNLFCPFRPNGAYMLNLAIYEERTVCKMLCELAKQEGMANMQAIKLDGKPVEKLTPDFVRRVPETGIFEATYFCPPEKENADFREATGRKYLDWSD